MPGRAQSTPTPAAHAWPVGRRLCVLLATETTLLEAIARFVPLLADEYDIHECDAFTHNLQDLSALSRVYPGFGAYLGPTNEAFWRSLVLERFDFSGRNCGRHTLFNVDDQTCNWARVMKTRWTDEDDEEPDDLDPSPRDCADSPRARRRVQTRAATEQAIREMPILPIQWMLQYHVREWYKLANYTAAWWPDGEYDFLSAIQNGSETLDDWPSDVEACGLYLDLVVMADRLCPLDATMSTDDTFIYACMLGYYDEEIESGSHKFLDFCGFNPHYWNGKVSSPWPGVDLSDEELGELPPSAQAAAAKMIPAVEYAEELEQLHRTIRERFTDWRYARFVDNQTFPTIGFFVGKRRRTNRWMGYFQLKHCDELSAFWMGIDRRLEAA